MNILFVCMGNTCRSPMAKAIAEKMLTERGKRGFFDSAGICAENGLDMSKEARSALQNRFGNEPFLHTSRQIRKSDPEDFDRIITATKNHEMNLKARFGPSEKILSFPEDIEDPWGGTEEDYKKCAEKIEEGLLALLEKGIFDD